MVEGQAGRRARPDTASPGRLIAHRGASGAAPENTLAALREAHRQGARWVEFDVALLGDGTPVLHHDATLARTSDRRGRLDRLVAADLAGIDSGSWFDARFRGEPVATLEAALDLIDELGLSANLEMKPHRTPAEAMAGAVAEALARRAWRAERVLVSSFDIGALRALRRRLADQPLAFICHRVPRPWRAILEDVDGTAIHVDLKYLKPRMLEAAAAEGVTVRTFTANDPAAVVGLREAGLGGVITDRPDRFLADPEWATWAAPTQAA